ncbi:hypothetical protein, partial [Kitasatospora sp. NPDC001225]
SGEISGRTRGIPWPQIAPYVAASWEDATAAVTDLRRSGVPGGCQVLHAIREILNGRPIPRRPDLIEDFLILLVHGKPPFIRRRVDPDDVQLS